ncbi:MAG: class I SAM-dependent methyltransferase, partial [Chthoniobacterales bacterium]
MSDTTSKPCPLCHSVDCRETSESLSGEELRTLWQELGQQFSADAWDSLAAETQVTPLICHHCGFQFFDPALAGNAAFYEELEHPNYYSPRRPEFERSVAFARKHNLKRVLDVGCGTGSFLDLAKGAGIKTYGLELNRSAAERARTKGHTIFESLLNQIPDASAGFDLVTLFQVLEHVPMPGAFIRTAASLLRPSGYIAVSVPSADGFSKVVPLDPHQWPPHHVSRWRRRDFIQLAHTSELILCESGGDPLLGADIRNKIVLQNRLRRSLGRRSIKNVERYAETISFIYRKSA